MRGQQWNFSRILRTKTSVAVNVLLLGLLAWNFSSEHRRNRALDAEIDALQARAEELREGNHELADLREKFAGVGELEREARLKLNLRKPGEEVVVLRGEPEPRATTDDAGTERAAGAATDEGRGVASNAAQWYDYFFRHDAE